MLGCSGLLMNCFISVSTMLLGKLLVIKVCLIFLSSLRNIVREENSNLAREISVFIIVLL